MANPTGSTSLETKTLLARRERECRKLDETKVEEIVRKVTLLTPGLPIPEQPRQRQYATVVWFLAHHLATANDKNSDWMVRKSALLHVRLILKLIDDASRENGNIAERDAPLSDRPTVSHSESSSSGSSLNGTAAAVPRPMEIEATAVGSPHRRVSVDQGADQMAATSTNSAATQPNHAKSGPATKNRVFSVRNFCAANNAYAENAEIDELASSNNNGRDDRNTQQTTCSTRPPPPYSNKSTSYGTGDRKSRNDRNSTTQNAAANGTTNQHPSSVVGKTQAPTKIVANDTQPTNCRAQTAPSTAEAGPPGTSALMNALDVPRLDILSEQRRKQELEQQQKLALEAQKKRAEELRQKQVDEQRRRQELEERQKLALEAQKKRTEELRQKQAEEEERRKILDEQRRRQELEEQQKLALEAQKKHTEELRQKQAEEEERKMLDQQQRRMQELEERQKLALEARKKRTEELRQRELRQKELRQKQAEEERSKKAEEQTRQLAAAEQKKAEIAAVLKAGIKASDAHPLIVPFEKDARPNDRSPTNSCAVNDRPAITVRFTPTPLTADQAENLSARLTKWDPYWSVTKWVACGVTSSVDDDATKVLVSSVAQCSFSIQQRDIQEMRAATDWGVTPISEEFSNSQMRLIMRMIPVIPTKDRADTHLWPKGTFAVVNSSVLTLRQRKQQAHDNKWQGLSSLLDLTSHIRNPTANNQVKLCTYDNQQYFYAITLCKYNTPATLFKRFLSDPAFEKLSRERSTARATTFTKQALCMVDDSDDEAGAPNDEAGKFVFTLTCPFSKTIMLKPVRGKQCKHFQCFDLSLCLESNRIVSGQRWRCIVCEQYVSLQDLEFCTLTEGLVHEFQKDLIPTERDRVEFCADGSYKLLGARSQRTTNKKRNAQEVSEASKSSDRATQSKNEIICLD